MSEVEGVGCSLYLGDSREVMAAFEDCSVDSIVCDPPYGLSKEPDMAEVLRHWLDGDDYVHGGGGFMGKSWDSFVPGPAVWREALRVLKPGGYAVVFAGSRTVDIMGLSLRLAGFEIRDQLQWLYGSGFPKSMNVGKAIDKAARGVPHGGVDPTSPNHGKFKTQTTEGKRSETDKGQGFGGGPGSFMAEMGEKSERVLVEGAEQWEGWGTALKPAHEPIILARKPLTVDGRKATVAANVLTYSTGAINIDATRIGTTKGVPASVSRGRGEDHHVYEGSVDGSLRRETGSESGHDPNQGRWPANVMLSHHEDCVQVGTRRVRGSRIEKPAAATPDDHWECHIDCPVRLLDEQSGGGGASRFFYSSKASKSERNAGMPEGEKNDHPTVKPIEVMEWLVKLVTPPGGVVLDPYVGSGTTAIAAVKQGFECIGIDFDEHSLRDIAIHRIVHHGGEATIEDLRLGWRLLDLLRMCWLSSLSSLEYDGDPTDQDSSEEEPEPESVPDSDSAVPESVPEPEQEEQVSEIDNLNAILARVKQK